MKKTYFNKKKKTDVLPSRIRPPVDDEEEKRHFQKVVNAFRSYRVHLARKIHINKQLLESIPVDQQKLLQGYKRSLNEMDKCVEHNQRLIDSILEDIDVIFENINPADVIKETDQKTSVMDIEKVQTTLKQFVRDWSDDGVEERNSCYKPIIDEIVKNFPPTNGSTENIKVLVPGSGLGRLAFEIASRGFFCQGNEFSLFMLFASNFVLNKCTRVGEYSVYPWIHQVDNNLSPEHQMHVVKFPDVNPSSALQPRKSQFTMAAGDFLEIYKNPEEWDCIATCFFIDCANNIVDFIEKIYFILKPGGVWINLGPLLYHFSNMPGEFSIEPPYSVVKEVITGIGFKIEREEINVKTKYGQNPNSMLQYEYNSVFFVSRKPEKLNM